MGLRSLSALFFAATALAPSTASAETVYLISGGYVSCRTSWNDPTSAPVFQAAVPRLAPKSFVAACYRNDSTVLAFRSDLTTETTVGGVEALTEAVRGRMAAAEPGSKLVVIGHSYGGWAVIKAAAALAGEVDVAYLATIDPVSTTGCPPAAYLDADEPFGPCTVAPEDLEADFVKLHDAGVTWVQFYQDRYDFIQSTPIAEATRNVYLTYPNLSDFWAWQAHALMDGDPRVWDVLVHDIPLLP